MIIITLFCLIVGLFGESFIDLDTLDYDDAYNYLLGVYDCGKIFEKPLPIHDNSSWVSMRNTYEEVMRDSGLLESSNNFVSGFEIKYFVNYNKKNKRSIFAKENIKKGQVVYQHTSQAAFPDLKIFNEFLNHISTDLACDAIKEFVYESNYYTAVDSGVLTIDFDDMSYISDEGEMNIDYDGTSKGRMVALRDIHFGEELICNRDDWSNERFDNEHSTAQILRELNNCKELKGKRRPIFGKPTWILMQKIYEELSHVTMSQDDFGFRVKYSVDYSETHGRGLYAREKIRQGQLVYEHKRDAYLSPDIYPEFLNRLVLLGNKRKAKNQDPEPYLDFLNISPDGLICDIDMWKYGETKENYNLDLDDMVYCNSANLSENINYFDDEMKIHATRDIDVGEEMLCSY